MQTLEMLVAAHGVEVDGHLDRQLAVPVSAGLQRQGDVLVLPVTQLKLFPGEARTAVPKSGVAVVRGENGGNTHLLLAQGDVRFDGHDGGGSDLDLRLGVLTVGDGAAAFLAHPEHGYAGIAPGTYEIRRQREQRDAIALVAD